MAKSKVVGLRIKINSDAARQILNSPEVFADIDRRVQAGVQAAGGAPDFEGETKRIGGSSKLGRVMGYVRTASAEGKRRQAEDHVLERSIDAMR